MSPAVTSPAPAPTPFYTSTRSAGGGTVGVSAARAPDGGVVVEYVLTGFAADDQKLLVLHWAVVGDSGGGWMCAPAAVSVAVGEQKPPFGDGIANRVGFVGGNVRFHVDSTVVKVPASGATDSDSEEDDHEQEEDSGNTLASLVAILVRSVGGNDTWLHAGDGKGDLSAALAEGGVSANAGRELARKAARAECDGLNLYRRFCVANTMVDGAAGDASGAAMGALLAWLRLSYNRVLPWYEGSSAYQGKDMAHVQKALAAAMAAASASGGCVGLLARLGLAVLPRGGGDGDAIRMGILHLMRDNGIKEGHRAGIEDPFIAQWHQKLHSNTTKDDIAIGEAHLHFLAGSGDWGDFWSYLWDNYKLSKDDLASMKAGWRTNGITGPALHMPHLIPAFKHLLWIIKVAHSGASLDEAAALGRGGIPDDLRWDVDDLLKNRDQWWVPGKIVSIRLRMERCWRHPESRDPGTNRNVALLDVALESFFKTKVEGTDLGAMSRDDRANFLTLALQGGVITAGSIELKRALATWKRLLGDSCGMERWSKDWSLAADAALESVSLAVALVLDRVARLVQTPAEIIGKAVKADKAYIVNFGEEVVRGHALFPVSAILASLQPEVRAIAGLSPWQLISVGHGVIGGKVCVKSLSALQGEDLTVGAKAGTIVLSEELGGLEDVPPGVVAVITKTPVDLLSHIAIRARNTGIMLASCTDAEQWAELIAKDGTLGKFALDATTGAVTMSTATEDEAALPKNKASSSDLSMAPKIELVKPAAVKSWTLVPAAYRPNNVGGKALSLSKLGTKTETLGADVTVPASLALPFGCFDRALKSDPDASAEFSSTMAALKSASSSKNAKATRKALKAVRKAVRGVSKPADLESEFESVGSAFASFDDAVWEAIKGVWASKWTERAYLSRRACSISEDDLCMSVLCMDLVPAEYAFVLHTSDPVSGSTDTIFGEVVVGLGETLVGNSPGRALSFSAPKSGGDVTIHSLPSKLHGFFAPDGGSIIARSDSNGEDLEGFAGAGLYDSICARPSSLRALSYDDEKLVWDAGFRSKLVKQLVDVAKAVETVAGSAQDIEGCMIGDQVYLVQSRAQI